MVNKSKNNVACETRTTWSLKLEKFGHSSFRSEIFYTMDMYSQTETMKAKYCIAVQIESNQWKNVMNHGNHNGNRSIKLIIISYLSSKKYKLGSSALENPTSATSQALLYSSADLPGWETSTALYKIVYTYNFIREKINAKFNKIQNCDRMIGYYKCFYSMQ